MDLCEYEGSVVSMVIPGLLGCHGEAVKSKATETNKGLTHSGLPAKKQAGSNPSVFLT